MVGKSLETESRCQGSGTKETEFSHKGRKKLVIILAETCEDTQTK